MAAQDQPVPWAELPSDVLSVIGGLLSCPNQLSSATRVCKTWNQAISSGAERLELDMNPCHQAWGAKVEQLQRLTPALSRCKAHVSTAVPKTDFGANIRQLAGKLQNIQHLDLELSEGYEWSLEADDELRELSNLRSLTISGGVFSVASAERLLSCLARSCPLLEELRVLPEPTCGLGDDQVDSLLDIKALRVLEFRAYRLTAVGLTRLAGLPHLAALSCHGLDAALDAASAHCFAASATLQQLHLGCDYEVPEEALQQLRDVAGGLSMCFRWTDKLTGLLRTARLHLQSRLVRLDLGAVRLVRDPSSLLMEPLAALTALSDLRMRVYSNGEQPLTLHLSQLAALTNLQVLHLAKQHAYFPEQRRFSESNISVPLSADSAASLAAGCRRLRALRLSLGASDVTAEGLAALRGCSSLKSLSVSAEPFGSPPQPVPLDLLDLPPGLTSLELRNIDVISHPADLAAAAAAAAAAAVIEEAAADIARGGCTRDGECRGPGGVAAVPVVVPCGGAGSAGPAAVCPGAVGACDGGLACAPQQHMGSTAVPGGQASASSSSNSSRMATDGSSGPGGGGGSGSSAAGRNVLMQLESLKLESCRLRPAQLEALCPSLVRLQRLRLSHVAGLSDAGLCGLSVLTGLTELALLAPSNRAVSQASLAALAPLRNVRYLTWQSDDLTALGPVLAAFTHFTTLRSLSLSCSSATLERACGGEGPQLFHRVMPYCRVDFIK